MKFSLLMINKHSYIHGSNRHTDKLAAAEEWDPLIHTRAQHKIIHIMLYGYVGKAVGSDN
jgi:hypothetical protein